MPMSGPKITFKESDSWMNVSQTIKKAFIKGDSTVCASVGHFEVLKPLSYCFKQTIGFEK